MKSSHVLFLIVGLLGGTAALASSTTVISTTNFSYNGSNQSRSYHVPSGANCVVIQAWGTTGYVGASYAATSGATINVTLSNSSGGSTTVQTSNGTVSVTTSACTAGGSAYGVTTNTNTADGGPSSPGAGNSYPGYVTITADDTLYTLSISPSPSAGGSVAGAGNYAPGTKVSISESAFPGYTDGGWGGTGGSSVASPSSASSTITMTSDETLLADFNPLVPVFTSSNPTQVLVVGQPYSYQVTASQAPLYTASGLPSGLVISSLGLISGTPTSAGSWSATITASENAVAVQEMGAGAGETAIVSSSSLGNNLDVDATILDLQLNGAAAVGFCIDPWHWSVEGQALTFNWETLASGPKVADGMGTSVAIEIEQLWDQYYSTSISNTTAAGLQIAIWDLVSASISAQTGGSYWYTLNSSNNYGASSMISWVEANPDAPTANLEAVTGAGQDYVTAASGLPQTSAATTTQTLPFIVYATPSVTGGSATIPVNQAYSFTISATANPTSYNANGLPAGLSINAYSGVISGAPSTAGTYTIVLEASNPAATGTGTLTLTVTPAYKLSIAASPSGGGSFTGAGTYSPGTVVTISESAGSGYRTAGWGGTNGGSTASSTSASTTITMTGNMSIDANFVQQGTLYVTAGTGGTATGSGTYDVGSVVPIAATPTSPYTFQSWSGSGVSNASAASTSVTVAAGSETVAANFTPEYTLSISGSNSNAGTFTGAGTYPAGTVVNIGETANSGYRTAGWGGANASSTASFSSASTTITMTGNMSLTADFVQQGTLVVTAGTGGTATGSGTYDVGTVVPIVATPSSSYLFGSWSGTGLSNANVASTTVTVAGGTDTIAAAFTATYTLSITASNPNGGTDTGAGTYAAGTVVNISETAAAGYRTAGWGGANASSTASSSSASTTITMTGNMSLTADFVQQGSLLVTAGTGGSATGSGTYDVGTVVPITATPSGSYAFNAWSGSDIANTGSAATTVTIAAGADVVSASFTPYYTLSISDSNPNGGTSTGAGSYPAGTVVNISETASSGYRAAGWGGTNASSTASSSSPSTTIAMTGNMTLIADFVQQGTLVVSAGVGGTATGSGTYDVGTAVPIAATATSSYVFNSWSGADVSNSGAASTSVTVAAGTDYVSASFTPTYTLSISGSSPSGGSFTGAGSYPAGTVVSIAETANSGYRTAGWGGADAGSTASSSSASTTITMNANMTLVADFVQQGTLVVSAGTGGTATGSGTYDVGTVVTIAATPSSSYVFGLWSGNDITNTTAPSTTVTVPAGTDTVSASFTPTYTLTISGSDPDGGSFTGEGTYPAGTVVNIAESAGDGYRAAGWGGPDAGSTASSTSAATTITMTANATLVADFIQQVALTVDAGAGGTASGGGTYDINSTVPIAATASTGYGFNDWTGASTASSTSGSTTITLTGDTTITANFAPLPPTVNLTAASTAYTGSPFYVSSLATAPASDLTLHSIEWLSPAGAWTPDTQDASGATDTYAVSFTFPTTGVWTVRAGASIDNGTTWVYSPNVQVTVSNGIVNYTLETMAVPVASVLNWYSSSPVVQETYEVQHVNPTNPGGQ